MLLARHEDLPRRTASDKVLHDKAFNIAINPKYDGYQRGIPSMAYKFFNKKSFGGASKSRNMPNQHSLELASVAKSPTVRDN